MQRLVLRSYGINGDTGTAKGLYELDKILGIGCIVGRIQPAARPGVVGCAAADFLHLHPLWAGPRRCHYLQVRIDGQHLLQHGNDIVRLILGKGKVFYAFLVAQRIHLAAEVAAPDADARIAYPKTLCGREGAPEQFAPFMAGHLHQVIARAVSEGIAKAVHRLELLIGHQAYDVGAVRGSRL